MRGFMDLLTIKTAFPTVEKILGESGSTYYLMPIPKLPLIRLAVVNKRGTRQDPAGLEGLTYLTSKMLLKGTKKKGPRELEFEMDYYGFHFSAPVHHDYSSIKAGGLSRHFQKLIQLTREILLYPVFPEEEFQKTKEKIIFSIKRTLDHPSHLAAMAFMAELFGYREYGMPDTGPLPSVERLQLQDVMHFFPEYAQTEKAFFLIGDFSPAEADLFITLGESISARTFPVVRNPVSGLGNSKKVVVVDKPDSSQVQIQLGLLTIPHSHPDYYPLRLGTIILGGDFSSRLMQEIRVKKGYSYGAYAHLFSISPQLSIFNVSTHTRPENIANTYRIILEEIDRMKKTRVRPAELIKHKNYIIGQYPLSIERMNDLMRILITAEKLEIPLDNIRNFPEIMADISAKQIQEAFVNHFPAEQFTLVLLGPAPAILKQLPDGLKDLAVVRSGRDIVDFHL